MSSESIVAAVRQQLSRHPPFSLMRPDEVELAAGNIQLAHFAPGDTVVAPGAEPLPGLYIVADGVVERVPARAGGQSPSDLQLVPGDAFPLGALLAGRPAAHEYRALGRVVCWLLPRSVFDDLLRRSESFLDFCKRGLGVLLERSQQELQASYAQQTAQLRSLDAPLRTVMSAPAATVQADTPLRDAFERMERERVGSLVVTHPGSDSVAGIFTRQDVVARVVLPQRPLQTPIGEVMTAPVVTLPASATAADAMLLMAERGIRHVPVTDNGAVAGIVTERDLFALQRRTLRSIGDTIAGARTVAALATAADDIRSWSHSLVAQGIGADFATRLISRLNDQLTARLLAIEAGARSLSLAHVCWMALGSEGREEQTIATDQDNGLVLNDTLASQRSVWLEFAQAVNAALDRCGYPLCRGGIMAGNPRWCLTASEWRATFDGWIDRGDPQSLLDASIFFDFRALAGDASLVATLRAHVAERAAGNPRFLKQMSDNALRNGPPPAWGAGMLEQWLTQAPELIDLKMNGTVPFVDGARLLALANRVTATNTADRLAALAAAGAVAADEARLWTDAFQFLQGLRLRAQQRTSRSAEMPPNVVRVSDLSEIDQRILREVFRQARRLQQRLALDYQR